MIKMAKWIVVYELDTDKKDAVMDFTKMVDDINEMEGLHSYDYEFYLKSFDSPLDEYNI